MVAMLEPTESWVARWQRIDKFHRGLYAVQVNGRLPDDIVEEIESKGVKYAPRDGSAE
jgi:transcription elongation factor SPT4